MWILFASLNPIAEATRGLFAKKASQNYGYYTISWATNSIPFLVFLPMLFFIELQFNWKFALALLGTGSINVIATILYMKALSHGDISQVMPMLSFTPLFLLVTSPIIVGEFPNLMGTIGVILVVAGSYLLNIKEKGKGLLYPFRSLLKNSGTRYMLMVAFLYSFSSNFDKVSIQNSSIIQHLIFINAFIFISLTIIVFFKKDVKFPELNEGKNDLILMSFFMTLMLTFHMLALSMTLVAYVISLKRLSGVISVLWGYIFLKEGDIASRLSGSAVMFAGVLFIVLS